MEIFNYTPREIENLIHNTFDSRKQRAFLSLSTHNTLCKGVISES